MTGPMKLTFLGTGSSGGTPDVHRGWCECDPANPKNRRSRPSVLIQTEQTTVLVDTSPDLRQQLLDARTAHLDAVLYTHAHADHLHGIDDLRAVNRALGHAVDCYGDAETLEAIRLRFGYVLEPLAAGATTVYKPSLVPNVIRPGESFRIGDVPVLAFAQDHGYGRTLGYRFGDVAYSTDVVELDDAAFDAVAGVKTWIVGVLVAHPHPTHAHVDKALAWMERAGVERGFFTHISPFLDHAALEARLPAHVRPAYDGLVIEA